MTGNKTYVRKTWNHYSSGEIQDFHRRVQQEFGWLNRRWGFTLEPEIFSLSMLTDPVVVTYWFEDPRDATVFAIKYL